MKDKKKLATGILAAALVLLAAGGVWTLKDYIKHREAREMYDEIAELARETETAAAQPPDEGQAGQGETAPYVSPINFEELRRLNPEIIGWLRIEGTKIDYPIVQAPDNDKYLKTDFEGRASVYGAIYLDFESEPDFSGKHSIIYGHHMKDGSMFKDIVRFKEEEYFNEHQDIVIYTPDREIRLRPLAALYTDADGMRRKTKFNTEEAFDAYVDAMTRDCAFRRMPEEKITRLYSFVTCSYEFDDARTALYACEVAP